MNGTKGKMAEAFKELSKDYNKRYRKRERHDQREFLLPFPG